MALLSRTPLLHKLGLLPSLLSVIACNATLGSEPGEETPKLDANGNPIQGDGDGDSVVGGDGDGILGDGDGDGILGDGDAPPQFEAFSPLPGQLRRLNRQQFKNAISDLLGVDLGVESLPADSFNGFFSTVGATTVATSDLGAEQYLDAVEMAVGEVFADETRWTNFLGCTPVAGDSSCFQSFLDTVGRRAWRRPLTAEEASDLLLVASTAETELGSAFEGTRWGTIALLSSLHFVYRPELGVAGVNGMRISGFEMATRLAFLIYNSLPDEELLTEAANGSLDTVEGAVAAAERMLNTPRGREAVAAFGEDYMRLDRIAGQAKDPGLYPEYGAALQQAMRLDMREVWAQVGFDDDGSVLKLFSTHRAYVNAELAALYELDPTGLDSNTYQTFDLPADGTRRGILSKAGFLSQFANQIEGSPTLRGKFIREALMCQEIPVPPPNVALELPEANPDIPTTKRDRLAQHREDPGCANCHAMMDPLGLPLEQFNAIGEFRTTELGLTIDASGEFNGTPVTDAANLGEVLSESNAVAECLVEKFYSYALGRPETPGDKGIIYDLTHDFEASGFRMRSLILSLVASESFSAVAPQE